MKPTLAALCIAPFAGVSFADVAFNNFGPGDSYDAGSGWIVFGPQTTTPVTHAFRFVAQASGAITNLVVPIHHVDGDNNFVFSIYSDAGAVPGTSLGVIGQTAGFSYISPPPPPPVQIPSNGSVNLSSGTAYWIVGAATGTTKGTWYQNNQSQTGLRAYLAGAGATNWTSGTVEIGAFRIEVTGSVPCYPNCDSSTGSPLLTANDFVCFLNRFVGGEGYADCDGVGGLTANDFVCFVIRYVQGCP